jgi:hypothetical protein
MPINSNHLPRGKAGDEGGGDTWGLVWRRPARTDETGRVPLPLADRFLTGVSYCALAIQEPFLAGATGGRTPHLFRSRAKGAGEEKIV